MQHERHKLCCEPATCRYLQLSAWQVKMECLARGKRETHTCRQCVCSAGRCIMDILYESAIFHPSASFSAIGLWQACNHIYPLHKPFPLLIQNFTAVWDGKVAREEEEKDGLWIVELVTCRFWTPQTDGKLTVAARPTSLSTWQDWE